MARSSESAFERLSTCLRQGLETSRLEDSRQLVSQALDRTERLAKAITTAATKRGRKGGTKTAERGPDYFRKIAAMRKTEEAIAN